MEILPEQQMTVGGRPLRDLRLLREVSIPEGIERVGSNWFYGTAVERVEVPSGVREIGACAFYACRRLEWLVFGRARARDQQASAHPWPQSGVSQLTIICSQAFCLCGCLARVAFPEGLEEIGLRAFEDSGLEEVVLPSSVRVVHQGAFCKCKRLRHARLNEGLRALGTDEYQG